MPKFIVNTEHKVGSEAIIKALTGMTIQEFAMAIRENKNGEYDCLYIKQKVKKQ